VPAEVRYQVQVVLTSHKSAAEATEIHDHYLKGTVFCGKCGARLMIFNVKNHQANVYPENIGSGDHSFKIANRRKDRQRHMAGPVLSSRPGKTPICKREDSRDEQTTHDFRS
jgi:hypothetical protein